MLSVVNEWLKLVRQIGYAIDVHTHIGADDAFNQALIGLFKRLNIGLAYTSYYPYDMSSMRPPSDELWRLNNVVLQYQRRYRWIIGFVHVNPLNPDAAKMAEYFLREGMRGIKLYRAVKVTHPSVKPILELAVSFDVPVLVHTAHRLYPRGRPNESDSADVAKAASRYPRLKLIMAHIGGGGDWEYGVLAIRETPNVYPDIGGSVADAGMVEYAVRVLGPDRVLFGTDNLVWAAVGRLIDAELSIDDKAKIIRYNAERIGLGEGQ